MNRDSKTHRGEDIVPFFFSLFILLLMKKYAQKLVADCCMMHTESLDLESCAIDDLSFIANMTWLKELKMGFESSLGGLKVAETAIGLYRSVMNKNKITDVTPLHNLSHLEKLYLDSNKITDISPLQNLSQLTVLDLRKNHITDVSPLQNMSHLTLIDLSKNQITDVLPLLPLFKKGIVARWQWEKDDAGIYLADNPLNPVFVACIQQGNAAVIDYLEKQAIVNKEKRLPPLAKARHQIAASKTGEAIETLQSYFLETHDTDNLDYLALLSNRYSRTQSERADGSISNADFDVEQTKIVKALLDLIKRAGKE